MKAVKSTGKFAAHRILGAIVLTPVLFSSALTFASEFKTALEACVGKNQIQTVCKKVQRRKMHFVAQGSSQADGLNSSTCFSALTCSGPTAGALYQAIPGSVSIQEVKSPQGEMTFQKVFGHGPNYSASCSILKGSPQDGIEDQYDCFFPLGLASSVENEMK